MTKEWNDTQTRAVGLWLSPVDWAALREAVKAANEMNGTKETITSILVSFMTEYTEGRTL